MQARMNKPAMVVPGALQALLTLGESVNKGGVPPQTLHLVHLRSSQINGCSVCVAMHSRELQQAGETGLADLHGRGLAEAPYFTDVERAALAFTEAVTRHSDRGDPVPD